MITEQGERFMQEQALNEVTPDNITFTLEKHEATVNMTLPEDPDVGMTQYRTIPVMQKFVQNELQVKREYLYNETGVAITAYEVRGFFQVHGGESFTLDLADYGFTI